MSSLDDLDPFMLEFLQRLRRRFRFEVLNHNPIELESRIVVPPRHRITAESAHARPTVSVFGQLFVPALRRAAETLSDRVV